MVSRSYAEPSAGPTLKSSDGLARPRLATWPSRLLRLPVARRRVNVVVGIRPYHPASGFGRKLRRGAHSQATMIGARDEFVFACQPNALLGYCCDHSVPLPRGTAETASDA